MPRGKPFQKGATGNAKGRPKLGLSLAEAMRERFPVERICEIAESLVTGAEDDRVRMQALTFIADRAHGKPLQAIELKQPDVTSEVDLDTVKAIPLDRKIALLKAADEIDAIAKAASADESNPQ